MAQVAASQRRYESEIQSMGEVDIANEAAGGRIADADYASEATKLAKQSLKMGLASQIMSNTSRLKDVLIPLTTEHFRSKVLSSTL
jgi:flagellin-like hook-associated protein FlgL